jgi:ABC-type Zn2+ transport system substrate-binding protein/surface adhesin
MQKQFDISQELIRLMNREHEQRSKMFERFEEQLAEKDRQIDKLRSTIEALEVLVKK